MSCLTDVIENIICNVPFFLPPHPTPTSPYPGINLWQLLDNDAEDARKGKMQQQMLKWRCSNTYLHLLWTEHRIHCNTGHSIKLCIQNCTTSPNSSSSHRPLLLPVQEYFPKLEKSSKKKKKERNRLSPST